MWSNVDIIYFFYIVLKFNNWRKLLLKLKIRFRYKVNVTVKFKLVFNYMYYDIVIY